MLLLCRPPSLPAAPASAPLSQGSPQPPALQLKVDTVSAPQLITAVTRVNTSMNCASLYVPLQASTLSTSPARPSGEQVGGKHAAVPVLAMTTCGLFLQVAVQHCSDEPAGGLGRARSFLLHGPCSNMSLTIPLSSAVDVGDFRSSTCGAGYLTEVQSLPRLVSECALKDAVCMCDLSPLPQSLQLQETVMQLHRINRYYQFCL